MSDTNIQVQIPSRLEAYTQRLTELAERAAELSPPEAASALVAAVATRKEMEAFFEPMTKAAYKAHKQTTAARDALIKPVKKVEEALRGRVAETFEEVGNDIIPAALEGLPAGKVSVRHRKAVRIVDEAAAIRDIVERGGRALDLLMVDTKKVKALVEALGEIDIAGVEVEEVTEPTVRLG